MVTDPEFVFAGGYRGAVDGHPAGGVRTLDALHVVSLDLGASVVLRLPPRQHPGLLGQVVDRQLPGRAWRIWKRKVRCVSV